MKLTIELTILWLLMWCCTYTKTILGHAVNENLAFRLVKPREIAYDYIIRPAKTFGGVFNFYYSGIPLVPADPLEACGELDNAEDVKGAVALVRRGYCSFVSKSIVADRAGALMVLIYDNDERNDGRFIDMIDDDTERPTTIPAAFMLGRDGMKIVSDLAKLGEHAAKIDIPINTTIPHSHLHTPPWTLW